MARLLQDEKSLFFTRVEELDELASETDDEATAVLEIKHCYSSDILYRERHLSEQRACHSQLSLTPAPKTTRVSPQMPPARDKMPAQTLSRRPTTGKVPSKLSKKQSRKKPLKLQPEGAQIFRGLTFC